MTDSTKRSLTETNYSEIRRRAADRLETDLKQFVAKYDAALEDVDGDEFRVMLTASAAIENMIKELKKPTLEERLDEIEVRLNVVQR